MKHIPTFENFVNENLNEATDKNLETAIQKLIDEVKNGYGWIDPEYVGYSINSIDKSIDFESKEIRDQIYQALIDAKVLNYAARHIPLKKGRRITDIQQIVESTKTNESAGLAYWSQYAKDDHYQIPKWMHDEAKTVSEVVALVTRCVEHWNDETEGDRVSKPSEKHIGDLAMQYFKQFKTINGNIISAMIAQES